MLHLYVLVKDMDLLMLAGLELEVAMSILHHVPGKSIVTTMVTPDNITSILTIPDLRDRDGGRYRCRYNNSGGETDSTRARLIIGSKC